MPKAITPIAAVAAALLLGLGWGLSSAHTEANLRDQCEERSRALGARAPLWEAARAAPARAADPCARSQRQAALTLVGVLERFPEVPAPRVRVDPGVGVDASAELEARSGTILINPASLALADPSVWLHELAHLQARGARPVEKIAVWILRAYEEAVADFYAASLNQRPQLGVTEGGAVRDVSKQQQVQESEWPSLAMGRADPHRFGAALAAELWRAHAADPGLARDLVRGLAALTTHGLKGARGARVLGVALASTPRRSRARLAAALRAWLPEQLHPSLEHPASHVGAGGARWAPQGVVADSTARIYE